MGGLGWIPIFGLTLSVAGICETNQHTGNFTNMILPALILAFAFFQIKFEVMNK